MCVVWPKAALGTSWAEGRTPALQAPREWPKDSCRNLSAPVLIVALVIRGKRRRLFLIQKCSAGQGLNRYSSWNNPW